MRQDREDRHEETGQMTSRIAKEGGGTWKVEGQKSAKRPGAKKGQTTHKVVAAQSGGKPEENRGNGCQPATEAVHVVHEVKRIHQSHDPKNRDKVAEDCARHKKSDANTRGGHQKGDHDLAKKLEPGRQLIKIVEQSERKHGEASTQNGHHLSTP